MVGLEDVQVLLSRFYLGSDGSASRLTNFKISSRPCLFKCTIVLHGIVVFIDVKFANNEVLVQGLGKSSTSGIC